MASELHRGDGDRDFVRSLQRGLEVVRALGHPGPGMTLAEVARAIGANRASTRRSLLGLEALGYVRSDGRRFTLTPKVLSLGYGYRSRLALPEVARPHLQRLMEETGEFSSLSVLDGDETVCVAHVAPPRIMNVAMPVGTRLPAYATCVGRVLLAELAPQDLDAYLGRVELRALTPATLTSPARLRAELNRVRRRRWARRRGQRHRGRQRRRARGPHHRRHPAQGARPAAAGERRLDRARPGRRRPVTLTPRGGATSRPPAA